METEAGRTTDPVRMYMREMGTVELLTREGEIVIAKRIEEGIRELMAALAHFPGAVQQVLNEYDLVTREERRLADIMVGYLDPAEDVPSAWRWPRPPLKTVMTKKIRHGPDPVEAKSGLPRQAPVQQDRKSHRRQGSRPAKAVKEMEKLGELFKFFKLTPGIRPADGFPAQPAGRGTRP